LTVSIFADGPGTAAGSLAAASGAGVAFDPYAPEAQRIQQLSVLRAQFTRLPQAG